MSYLQEEAGEVKAAMYQVIGKIGEQVPFDEKTKEIMLCGMFAVAGYSTLRGLGHHVERAAKLGASREEILGAILLGLPVVGLPHINHALEVAEAVLEKSVEDKV